MPIARSSGAMKTAAPRGRPPPRRGESSAARDEPTARRHSVGRRAARILPRSVTYSACRLRTRSRSIIGPSWRPPLGRATPGPYSILLRAGSRTSHLSRSAVRMAVEKAADQQVGFLRSAVPGAEAEAFEAVFAVHGLHAGLAGSAECASAEAHLGTFRPCLKRSRPGEKKGARASRRPRCVTVSKLLGVASRTSSASFLPSARTASPCSR